MTKFSIVCAHCGEKITPERKRKYCTDKCRDRAAYAKKLARAPRCPKCNGPHLAEGRNPREMCNKCYATGVADLRSEGMRSCVDCGREYKWNKQPRCSACRYEATKRKLLEAGRICAECDRPATAGTYCHTHFAYLSRARTDPTGAKRREQERARYAAQEFNKTCEFCGDAFVTKWEKTRTCSVACKSAVQLRWSNSREVEPYRTPERRARVWVGHVIPPRKGLPLANGPCQWCGEAFTGPPNAVYCSDRCSMQASWKRKYDRRGEFKVTDRVRHRIYNRDGWVCQLCLTPVPQGTHYLDPQAPTLDHIIPQSHHLIPDHSEGNLRLAHRECNVRRGNKMEYEHLFA